MSKIIGVYFEAADGGNIADVAEKMQNVSDEHTHVIIWPNGLGSIVTNNPEANDSFANVLKARIQQQGGQELKYSPASPADYPRLKAA